MPERRALAPLPDVPFVSIFSSFYNHEQYAAAAIESVIAQDWPADRLEWVIFDDGSQDGTADVIASLVADVPWITFHARENVGLRATVNRALPELRGDVITSIAGDDLMLPGKLRTQAEHLAAHPNVGLVYSDMEIIDDGGRVVAPSFMRANGLIPYAGQPLGKLLSHNFVSGGGIMLRADMLSEIHPIPDHAAWEDYWWAWAVASVADLDYLDVPLYQYRQHATNLAHGVQGDRLLRAQREELKFRRWLLGAIAQEDASLTEIVTAHRAHETLIGQMWSASGEPREQLLPMADQDPAAAAQEMRLARGAHAAGDLEGSAWHALQALRLNAHDPDCHQHMAELAAIISRAPAMPAELPQTRGVVVLADADELYARPELLQTYATAVGPDDDVTLVIHAVDWPYAQLDGILTSVVGRACLHTGTPDMAAVPGPAALRAPLLEQAHAVLSADPARAAGLPRFGAGDEAGLQALAAGSISSAVGR